MPTPLPGITMRCNAGTSLWSLAIVCIVVFAGCKGESAPPVGPVPPTPPVVSLAPTASFTATATANAFEPVLFDATASASKDGSALQFVWDFGNGQLGGGKVITRSFGVGGARSVTLTVIDGANRVGTVSKTVTVSPPATPVSTVSAQGAVKGLDGAAISGVQITQVGGTGSGTTDTLGKARLSLGIGSPLTLRFTKAGLADQVLNLQLPAASGTDAYFEVVMRPRDAALTLPDAAVGGSVTGRDGAVLTLPANALVNAAGAAVSGAVQISITPVDVTESGGGGFPGGFDGLQQNGTATPIVSFGTAEYVLNAAGQRVQVAPGKSATIELPLYATGKLNGTVLAAGDSTPLWSLDETTGSWVQEGMGVVVASPASPSGFAMRATVTHFSWWNSDLGFEPYGPRPKCVYDTDIGIPGANNTFATATICNMLAEIERGLAPRPRVLGAGAGRSASASNHRIAGFALRRTVPIAGGVTIPVPAGVNISLKATALNGTWGGSAVVNGAVGVQAEATIKMRPLFTVAGPTPEAITLPFDAQRSLAPLQPSALFTFAGVAQKFARIAVRPVAGSVLTGRVRLLQGTTVLGSAPIASNGLADIVALLPTNATYTIEIAGDAAAAFRLQAELLGGVQEEALAIPFNIQRVISPYSVLRGTVTVTAPTTVYLARAFSAGLADVRLLSSTGTVLVDAASLPDSSVGTTLTLPAAGTYAVEVRPRNPAASVSIRVTLEQTLWLQVAPPLDNSGVYQISDAQADRNGRIVVGYAVPSGTGMRFRLQRWTGTAWEAAAADLIVDRPCSDGGLSTNFTFDNTNRPVVLTGRRTDPSTATLATAHRYSNGAWQALGPNNGALPLVSASGGACATFPAVAVGADDAPVVAYGHEANVVVQRWDGTQWKGLVKADTSGDSFPLQGASYDLKVDASGRTWFVTGSPTFSAIGARVRRFDVGATKWDSVGSVLPQTNTSGLQVPRLRFDAAGIPIIAWIASVGTGGVASPGTAVYRYNGTDWLTTGGYQLAGGVRVAAGPNDLGFALFNGEALLSWTSLDPVRNNNGVIVQRNSTSGWAPIGAGNGEVVQFNTGGATAFGSYSSKLIPVGGELYLVLISNLDVGGTGVSKLVLLRRVAN